MILPIRKAYLYSTLKYLTIITKIDQEKRKSFQLIFSEKSFSEGI